MLNISDPNKKPGITLLQLGFRPFFLGATSFSILAITLWMGIYTFGWKLQLLNMSPTFWHAHEMLFGYLLAVIAGFLLTAVKNWTGQQTLQGTMLLLLFSIWAIARLMPVFNIGSLLIMAMMDGLFLLGLILAIAIPVIKVRQWGQVGILSIPILLLIANRVFYAGLMEMIDNGATIGLYSGLYLILTLVFVMARRVIPFFIETGTGNKIKLTNRYWLDVSSLALLIILWVTDVLISHPVLTAMIAAALFILHGIRLKDWHTRGIWQSPMLWILYLAYSFLTLGFALKALAPVLQISPSLSVHAFVFGGISVLTLGMMSRVSLGHTGRNVLQPPAGLSVAFILLLAGAVIRVILPLLMPTEYALWVVLSQVCWIIAFSMFLILFFPILISPRIDGRPG